MDSQDTTSPVPLRFLKVLVAVLGVLVIIALGVVLYGLSRKSAGEGEAEFGTAHLSLPKGSTAGNLAVGAGRIVIHFRTDAGEEGWAVVSLRDGRTLGIIHRKE